MLRASGCADGIDADIAPDYVDEFVAQIDAGDAQNPDGQVFYMLQDGNYNVVALVNASGAVVEQYAYRPYGSLVAVDSLGSAPVNTAGHQGLFYEHIDSGAGLEVGAAGFYYNRNRFYSPALGRFLQRDPNETGLARLRFFASSVGPLAIETPVIKFDDHFRDGINVFAYQRSNPTRFVDPMGGSAIDLTITFAFWTGYIMSDIAMDKKLDSSIYADLALLGTVGATIINHYKVGPGIPSTPWGWGTARGYARANTWAKKEYKRLIDWADDTPAARRWLNKGTRDAYGLFGGGLIAQTLIGYASWSVGIVAGALDEIEYELYFD